MNKVPLFREISETCTEYRASSIDGVRLSPAQLLTNRQLKTKLPVSSELLKPEVVKSKQKELIERQKSQKFYYDKKSIGK
jgi:hypothetical protein